MFRDGNLGNSCYAGAAGSGAQQQRNGRIRGAVHTALLPITKCKIREMIANTNSR
jgi:hypothetical protein